MIQTQLQHAMSYFQQNDLNSAEKICHSILQKVPNQADAQHMLALINKKNNNFTLAEKYFLSSIENSAPANFLINIANFFAQTSQPSRANNYYEKAHKLTPNNLDLLYNWTLILNQLSMYEEAIQVITKAIKLNNTPYQFYNALGSAYKNIQQFNNAIDAFKSALKRNPNDFFSWHNLGTTYREIGKPSEALNCYAKITELGKNIPEYHFNHACALYDIGELQQSARSFKRAIELKPDYVLAHESLNNLYWENSKKDEFLSSYNLYLKSNSKPTEPMYFSYAAQLILSKDHEKASDILKEAISVFGEKPPFCHALATIYIKDDVNIDESIKLIESASQQDPNNVRYRIDMANILIREKSYREALAHLDFAQKLAPLNQELWAYKGICWRLLNDERSHWLNNYDEFVVVQSIEPPKHYDNLEHFISKLKPFMTQLHTSTEQPLDQSVSGGSQTTGNLLLNNTQIIQELKVAINNSAQKYIQGLPRDTNHPFLSRIKDTFNFAGCWSVLLNKKGFHTNHVHPEGWISGPTYISVPEAISPDDPKKSGWVHFGETSLKLGEREHKAVEHCPREGECVFFPSYMWHGTNPTISAETRITTPCDIQPPQ